MSKVVQAVAWSCPKKCGLAFAGPKAELAKAIAQHNRAVHPAKKP